VDYPTFRDYVTHLLKQAPISHKKFLERCLQIDKELTDLKDEYVKKFREQYKEIRQNAVERNDMVGGLIEKRVEEFIEDLEAKVKNNSFKSAKEAQKFVNSSRNYQSIITSIEEFISENPDKAGNLSKKLKVKIAELIYNVKQMQSDSVDQKTGKQMIKFGNVSFPIWEHKTKEKTKVRTELAISVDERTKGPGVKPEDYYCELMVKVQDSSGKSFEIPFHEDQLSKYGLENEKYYETPLSPSYITVKEAKKIIKTIKEMDSAKPNDLKTKYNEFRKKIEEFNEKFIQTIKTKWKGKWLGPKHAAENSEDKIWQTLLKEQENLTKEYVKFIQKSGLYAWLKLQNIRDRFSLQKEVFKNGQGYVPEKNPSWVRDPQTEKYLEIEVSDSGIGIPKDEQKNIFKKFQRATNAVNTGVQGSGIGLYVCQIFTEQMGGKIWFESAGEGKGTTFYVSFPINVV